MKNREKDHGAELIHQTIPEFVETEPRLTIGEARERLNTQLQCMADEIRAWGTVVDAKVDDAIDALIAASALTERSKAYWRLIDSAPKDGTPILIWDGVEHYVARWFPTRLRGDWDIDCLCAHGMPEHPRPTHWMPLPFGSGNQASNGTSGSLRSEAP